MKKIKLLSVLPTICLPISIASCACQISKQYSVYFYCGNMLVKTDKVVKDKTTSKPLIDGVDVKDWYTDEKLTNKFDFSIPITNDVKLYGDYKATIKYDFSTAPKSYDSSSGISSNSFGNILLSGAKESQNNFCSLIERGIVFNNIYFGKINKIIINISSIDEIAYLYCSKTFFGFENQYELHVGNNEFDLNDKEINYFVIQSLKNNIQINSITVEYEQKELIQKQLPTFNINTNGVDISSKENYVNFSLTTSNTGSDIENETGSIKLRGNSTIMMPKKSYRFKLDKKTSFFGLEKAKNWVLLADYADGSKMHNYSALSFAKLINGDLEFCPSPFHVNLILNGKNLGLYTFCEHIDEKTGRMNLSQNNIWDFTSLDQFNFMLERDTSNKTGIENVDYFEVKLPNGDSDIFGFKYPKIDDFVEINESGQEIRHDDKFYTFASNVKQYITNLDNLMYQYKSDKGLFNQISLIIDVDSLARYGLIDQTFNELDHKTRSFKFYKKANELIKFGPNWDYDLNTFTLPLNNKIVKYPYLYGKFNSLEFKESWSLALYNDETNGYPIFKSIWNNISEVSFQNYINSMYSEITHIDYYFDYDTYNWNSKLYNCVFDNIKFFQDYIINHISFLNNEYSK